MNFQYLNKMWLGKVNVKDSIFKLLKVSVFLLILVLHIICVLTLFHLFFKDTGVEWMRLLTFLFVTSFVTQLTNQLLKLVSRIYIQGKNASSLTSRNT